MELIMSLGRGPKDVRRILEMVDEAYQSDRREFKEMDADNIRELISRGYLRQEEFKPLLGGILVLLGNTHPFTEKGFAEFQKTPIERSIPNDPL